MLFIDFEKAFDSVEANAIWSVIQEQGVHAELINLLRNIYTDAASELCVNDVRVEIDIHRGVQQGDTISPKLFTACLEQISRRLPWDDRGININGRCLSNLCFADDIVLFANTADELQQMASELNNEADQVGLRINSNKTKAMSTTPLLNPIHLDDSEIEAVDNYIYLGQLVTIVRDHTREIRRRKQAGWAVFHQYRNFLTSHTVDMKYIRRLFNQCIIPAMLYGSECWALTKKGRDTITAAQRCMEKAMAGVNILNKKMND
uniref:Reverse transcriptase domain-containing protein n=1 Tax=Plectus sambesii TaxID=2011161 RepID=A0A914WZG4_9BILA